MSEARARHRSRRGGDGRSSPRNPTRSPGALLEAALDRVLALDGPADGILREFFRLHPELGRRERGRIADRCFAALRHRRLHAHLAAAGSGPLTRRLALLADREVARAAGTDRDPPMLQPGADEALWLRHVDSIPLTSLPPAVRYSLPDWLQESLALRLPDGSWEELADCLLRPAPLFLRANLLKTSGADLIARLAATGVVVHPARTGPAADGPQAPAEALRVEGHPALEALPEFADGSFEVQDLGSQLLVGLAGARRGQTVVDFCAGAGGKTLALAAAMRSRGQIYACDVSERRLARMRPRLARSGASNVQPLRIENEFDPRLARLRRKADLVLVDAPCSGSGTLRRNPDLKWRNGPTEIARLAQQQLSILSAASALVRSGGRLLYATCSLVPEENEAVALAFEAGASATDFERIDLRASPTIRPESNATEAGFLRLWPHLHGTDGFFVAAWERRARATVNSGPSIGTG